MNSNVSAKSDQTVGYIFTLLHLLPNINLPGKPKALASLSVYCWVFMRPIIHFFNRSTEIQGFCGHTLIMYGHIFGCQSGHKLLLPGWWTHLHYGGHVSFYKDETLKHNPRCPDRILQHAASSWQIRLCCQRQHAANAVVSLKCFGCILS